MKKTISIKSKLFIIPTIIGIIFLGGSYGDNINYGKLLEGIDAVNTNEGTDRSHFKSMVSNFCDAISKYNTETNDDLIYKSNESLFIYTLCKTEKKTDFFENNGFSEDKESSYIKLFSNDDGATINSLDSSLPGLYNNTEDFIQILFDSIISSYTSIKQANIYGYINDPSKKDFTEAFSKKHFHEAGGSNDFINICATDKTAKYPKTCKKLKEYFYGARNLINTNTNNILNDENIYKKFKDENNSDIITNGLYDGEMGSFINLIYNELLFYSIFVEYYSYTLKNYSDFKNWDTTEFTTKLNNNKNRVQQMKNNIETSRDAIYTTIKALKEIQYSFPIHIGFLMYSEDIYNFSSILNKTLTPIYTLHDTLRNVQKPE